MTWYKTGTVSVTQNSTTVTGVGTAFVANSRAGDAFLGPDGRWYEVTNFASNTALSISPAYQGPTVSGGAYAIVPVQGYPQALADAFNALNAQFGGVLAVLGTTPTLAGVRSALALSDTNGLSEGSTNKYFTEARVRAALMTGLAVGSTDPVAATDQLIVAISKLQAQANGKAAKGANNDITSLAGLTTALSQAQGGTGVTTIAALLAALQTAGAFGKTNILGTVSQSGGVPTGAIIETVSNANGTAIKYADGTMICRQTVDLGSVAIANAAGSMFASASQAGRAFPATFSGFPTCHISLISSNATAYAGTVALPTVSASQAFYVIAPVAAAQSITAVIIAIGRWF